MFQTLSSVPRRFIVEGDRDRVRRSPSQLIVKSMVLEVLLGVVPPPPYGPPGVVLPGLVTETVTVPALATSAAAIAAVSCCAVTWVVFRCVPFQFTTALLLKLLPFTVKVKAAAPAVAVFGTIALRTGTTAGCEGDPLGEL